MADEAITPALEATAEPTTTATPAAEPLKTDTQAEVMIPKSRFDEVNNKLKALESESTKAAKAAQAAEAKRLEEEGKFKELYEKQQAELQAAQAEAKANAIKLLQQQAATQAGFPLAQADRLKGDTLEEMVADAKVFLAALPKPAAPNINANSGGGGTPGAGTMSEAEKKELAARLGVNPKFIQ